MTQDGNMQAKTTRRGCTGRGESYMNMERVGRRGRNFH